MALSFSLRLPAHLLELLPPGHPARGQTRSSAFLPSSSTPCSTAQDSLCACHASSLPHDASEALRRPGVPLLLHKDLQTPVPALLSRQSLLCNIPVPPGRSRPRLGGVRAGRAAGLGEGVAWNFPGSAGPSEGAPVASAAPHHTKDGSPKGFLPGCSGRGSRCPQAPGSAARASLVGMRKCRPSVPMAQRTSLRDSQTQVPCSPFPMPLLGASVPSTPSRQWIWGYGPHP